MAIALGGNQINKAYLGTTEIQKMYLGVDLVFDNSIQPSELTPIMDNFRVEDATPDRVYFDLPLGEPTQVLDSDFIISGKTIIGLTISGGYFTVSEPFTFWEQAITIRKESGSGDMYDFTMESVYNLIDEPVSTGTISYAWADATGLGDGTSEANAYTSLDTAFAALSGGDTLYIKASDFGGAVRALLDGQSGTAANPIKIIGYKTTINDITSNYYTYDNTGVTLPLDSTEMPLNSTSNAVNYQLSDSHYVIIKNVQGQDGERAFTIDGGTSHVVLKNSNFRNSSVWGVVLLNSKNGSDLFDDTFVSVIDCIAINPSTSSGGGITLQGSLNLIDGCKQYQDNTQSQSDYYLYVMGDNSIIRKSRAEAINYGDSHGISVRGADDLSTDLWPAPSRWNLIEDCYVKIGGSEAIAARNYRADFNVFKNIEIEGFQNNSDEMGIVVQTGAQYNTFENISVHNIRTAISLRGGTESDDTAEGNSTSYNQFNNCIIRDVTQVMYTYIAETFADMFTFQDNTINNCTISNADYFIEGGESNLDKLTFLNNTINNCIITDITTLNRDTNKPQFDEMWSIHNSDLYVNGSWDLAYIGNDGNIDENPDFVSASDYTPQNELLLSVPKIAGVDYDYNNKERAETTTIGSITLTSESAGGTPPVDPDYYVSFTDGLDTNDGLTEQTAWKTLTKSREGMVAGNVIAYKRGDTWNELLNISNKNGTVNDNITLTAYGSGAKPIITAVYVYDLTWASEGGNIWSTSDVDRTVVRLKIDGQEVLNGSEAELGTSIPDLVQFYASDTIFKIYSLDSPENHVLEFSSHDVNTSDYYNVAMGVTGSSYLNFDNIEFKGGYFEGINITTSDNISFNNCSIGDMCNRGFYIDTSTNIFIDGNEFDTKFTLDYSGGAEGSTTVRGGSDGILIKGLNVGTISGNNYKNWGHASFSLVSDASVITGVKAFNNYMAIPDIPYGGAAGTDGVDCYDNEFYNNTYDGTKNVQFNGHNNHFHHNIIKNSKGTTLKANINGAGIRLQNYTDGVCYDNIVENNLIIDTENQGIYISGNNEGDVVNNIVRNNMVYNCGSGSSNIGLVVYIDSGVGSNNGNFFYNNDIYSDQTASTVSYYDTVMDVDAFNSQSVEQTVENNISGEPLFVAVDDYHQLEASPTVNAGTTALATLDYDGNTIPYPTTVPDIGIYESDFTDSSPNLIAAPYDLTDPLWDKRQGSITGTTETTPSGSNDGCIYTADVDNGTCRYTTEVLEAATQYNLTYWYKNIDSTEAKIFIYDTLNGATLFSQTLVSVTIEYQEYSFNFTTTDATTVFVDILREIDASGSAWNIRLTKV